MPDTGGSRMDGSNEPEADAFSEEANMAAEFAEAKTLPVAAGSKVAGAVPREPVREIGPYRLVERIGQGGFGDVFRAEQLRPVKREVALKLVRRGMGSPETVARFQVERQALAVMDHPNIARVYDAGTTKDGRPYFVMELVNGQSVTAYCESHRLPLRERLELFATICSGVHHAHQKGIIHRDLKPSNLLVEEIDGRPLAKVIDFGVAKAMTPDAEDLSLRTVEGQLIGTLQYMSPEQASGVVGALDTRSDVYSLGIVLYELLVGETPLTRKRLSESGFLEVVRAICEEEVPRPSTQLGKARTRPQPDPAVGARAPGPADTRALPRDLDWIVLRAVEKQPGRRYESAAALEEDIRRYLAHQPVSAAPPSVRYRVGKFARRHRAAFIGGLGVAATLVLGIVGSTWQAVRATRAERVARVQEQAASARNLMADDPVAALRMAFGAAERDLALRGKLSAPVLSSLLFTLDHGREWRRFSFRDHTTMTAMSKTEDAFFMGVSHGLWVCDRATGAIRRFELPLDGHALSALGLAGEDLIVGTKAGAVWRLGLNGQRSVWDKASHQGTVIFCGEQPGTGRLITVGGDRKVRVLDERGQPVAPEIDLTGFLPSVGVVQIDASGQWLALASSPLEARAEVCLVRLSDPPEVIPADTPHEQGVIGLAFDHRSEVLFGVSALGRLFRWNLKGGLLTALPVSQSQRLRVMAHHPSEPLLALGSDQGSIEVLTHQGVPAMPTLIGHQGAVTGLMFLDEGATLLSVAQDGTLRFWDLLGLQIRPPLPLAEKGETLCFSNDEAWVLAGTVSGSVRAMDFDGGQELFQTRLFDGRCNIIRSVPGADHMVCASSNQGEVALVDWQGREVAERLDFGARRLYGLSVAPDGKSLVVAVGDATSMRLASYPLPWSGEPDAELALGTIPQHTQYYGVAHTPDGLHVVVRGAGTLECFRARPLEATGWRQQLGAFGADTVTLPVAPRAGLIASGLPGRDGGGTGRDIGLFTLPDLRETVRFANASGFAHRIAIAPDASWLAALSGNSSLKLLAPEGEALGPSILVGLEESLPREMSWSELRQCLAVAAGGNQVCFLGLGEQAWMSLAKWRQQGGQQGDPRPGRASRPWQHPAKSEPAPTKPLAEMSDTPAGDELWGIPQVECALPLPPTWSRMEPAIEALVPSMAALVLGRDMSRLKILGAVRGPATDSSAMMEQNFMVAFFSDEIASEDAFVDSILRARTILRGKTGALSRVIGQVESVRDREMGWDEGTGMVRALVDLHFASSKKLILIYFKPLQTGCLGFIMIGQASFLDEAKLTLAGLRVPADKAPSADFVAAIPQQLEEALKREVTKAASPPANDDVKKLLAEAGRLRTEAEKASKAGDHQQAVESYQQAIELLHTEGGTSVTPDDRLVTELETRFRHARALRSAGQPEQAQAALAALTEHLTSARSDGRPNIDFRLVEITCEAWLERAGIAKDANQEGEALSHLDNATAAADSAAGATALNNLRHNRTSYFLRLKADWLRQAGDLKEAEATANAGIDLLESIPRHLRQEKWGVRWLETIRVRVFIARDLKDEKAELALAREAVETGESLYPFGSLREGRYRLLDARKLLFETHNRVSPSDREELIRQRMAMADLLAALHEQTPLNDSDLSQWQGYRRDTAKRQSEMGDTLSKAGDESAVTWLDAAIEYAGQTLALWPGPQNGNSLADALRLRGEHRLRVKDANGAVADAERAVELLRQSLAEKPDAVSPSGLSDALARAAGALLAAGDSTTAAARFDEAITTLQEALSAKPNDAALRASLSSVLRRRGAVPGANSEIKRNLIDQRLALWKDLKPQGAPVNSLKEAFLARVHEVWLDESAATSDRTELAERLRTALALIELLPERERSLGVHATDARKARRLLEAWGQPN